MKYIIKLQGLWFFSLVIFGIGVLLDLMNRQLNFATLFIFFIYCGLYYVASNQNEQKSNANN